MAVKIRLRRMGSRHQPSYRLVIADSRAPRDGAFIETIGHYNPRTNPATVVVNAERALHWLGHGAQPTDTARSLLRQQGILRQFAESRRPEEAPAQPE